jgi:GH24 family phage-related lysozyme (muramidase)
MSAVDVAMPRAKLGEGFRAHKYLDPRGFETIGYGFNIDAGISPFAAAALLRAQLTEREQLLSACWWAHALDDVRMSVVIEISFNVGLSGLLHFPKMLAAIGAKNWDAAHAECLDSDAARELPARYNVLAEILRTGVIDGHVPTLTASAVV